MGIGTGRHVLRRTVTTGDNLCIFASAAVQVSGSIRWTSLLTGERTMIIVLTVALLLGSFAGADAAAIAHAFTEVNTAQTTMSETLVDVPGASIASGNFVAGKKYLLYVTAQMTNQAATYSVELVALHGTTPFDDALGGSGGSYAVFSTASASMQWAYGWFTVWTAVSGEAIKLQFRRPGEVGTAQVNRTAMLAINLSDNLAENTDWAFAEDATDVTLTTAFTDGASVTVTPAEASNWLVLTSSQGPGANGGAALALTRISRSGEDASVLPEARVEVNLLGDQMPMTLARVFALTAASNTFTEQSAASANGLGIVRTHSSVFVLNLSKFKVHASAYTEPELALSATAYATQLQTLSITPTGAGDVWIGAYWGFDRNNALRNAKFRVQVDNVDQPAGQTTDADVFAQTNDATDEDPMVLSTLANLTATAHTVDLDASVDATTGGPTAHRPPRHTPPPSGQHRTLWAVTMELQ